VKEPEFFSPQLVESDQLLAYGWTDGTAAVDDAD
jgi:hypothetical protein